MTPGQLVKAVSLALNVPEETVVQHDRNLVLAGLRTKGGRGRSAPEVTPLDAARLFVATLASIRIRSSDEVVLVFEKTEFSAPMSDADFVAQYPQAGPLPKFFEEVVHSTEKFSDPAIVGLGPQHNFVEAIASLIAEASGPINDSEQYLERFAPIGSHASGRGQGRALAIGVLREVARATACRLRHRRTNRPRAGQDAAIRKVRRSVRGHSAERGHRDGFNFVGPRLPGERNQF